MAKHNAAVFKEPRGFIKVLQFIFSLVALSVLETYRGRGDLLGTNSDNSTNQSSPVTVHHTFEVEYPFSENDFTFQPGTGDVVGSGKYQSDARFYIAVSVFAFLYSLFVTPCYVLLEVRLTEMGRKYFFHADFVASVILAFLWLVASCVWARGAGGVPDVVDDAFDQFMTIQGCQNVTISCISDKPTYGGIIVAVLLGFLNCILWSGGIWFTLKETHWFTQKQQQDDQTTAKGQDEPSGVSEAQFKYTRSKDGELDGDGELESAPTDPSTRSEDIDVNVPPS